MSTAASNQLTSQALTLLTANGRRSPRRLGVAGIPRASPPCIFREIFHMENTRVKIAVCVKRVPDMDVRFKIASDGASVDETGVKFFPYKGIRGA